MLWVAEIGSAHGGDKSRAFELIRQAKYAGADIAKFQFGWTKEAQLEYAGNVNDIRYIDDWAEELKEWCDHFDIELMASIWSEEGLDVARSVDMKRYKISHQVAGSKLNAQCVLDGKEVFVSSKDYFPDAKYLYYSPEYPTYPEKCVMPLIFGHGKFGNDNYYYGYSSHIHGIADALLAVSRGAQYIEKHITLDKSNTEIRDNSFAITPDEFAQMARLGDEISRLV